MKKFLLILFVFAGNFSIKATKRDINFYKKNSKTISNLYEKCLEKYTNYDSQVAEEICKKFIARWIRKNS